MLIILRRLSSILITRLMINLRRSADVDASLTLPITGILFDTPREGTTVDTASVITRDHRRPYGTVWRHRYHPFRYVEYPVCSVSSGETEAGPSRIAVQLDDENGKVEPVNTSSLSRLNNR